MFLHVGLRNDPYQLNAQTADDLERRPGGRHDA
jgi:hypothetical protein